jgi:aspartate kinase
VCSARSGTTKALGTTNLLLQASKEALRPANGAANPGCSGLTSGTQTPLYPKRVGSGFFGSSGSGTEKDKMSSSIASLRDLKMTGNGYSRSGSPSPFQSSANPPSPTAAQNESGRDSPESYLAAFHATVDVLKRDHVAAARKQVQDEELLEELIHELERDCESLRSFLSAAQVRSFFHMRTRPG